MKLIPENHTQAISWVSQAWHRLMLTPAQTAEVFAKICGCENWQELSTHITTQRGTDYEPDGFVIITPNIQDKVHGDDWALIRKRQGAIMMAAFPFKCPEAVYDTLMHSLLESFFILDLPAITDSADIYEEPILVTLRSLHFDKSKQDADHGEKIKTDDVDHRVIEENLPISPERYFRLCKHLGWNPVEGSMNSSYLPYHKSFDFQDVGGNTIPAFILRGNYSNLFGGEELAEALRAITEVTKIYNAKRALIFSSSFLGATDDEGCIATSFGFLIETCNEGFIMLNACKSMKSIDSVFDLNKKFASVMTKEKDNEKVVFPKFILDKDLYMAKLFARFVPQQ